MTVEQGPRGEGVALPTGIIKSIVDWPAIFAGTVIAVAMSWLLLTFGAAIGISAISPWGRGGAGAETLSIGSAIWFALVQIFSVGMGAYFAGRLRPRVELTDRDEINFRDGANGLVVWALSLITGFILIMQLAAAVTSTAASMVSGAASVAGQVVSGAVNNPLVESAADRLFRAPLPAATPVPGAAATAPRTTLATADRDQVLRILGRSFLQGELSQEDQRYIAQVMANTTGMTPDEAAKRLNEVVADVRRTTAATAEQVQDTAATIGFWTAFVLLVTGLFAWWAATVGGTHRDEIG